MKRRVAKKATAARRPGGRMVRVVYAQKFVCYLFRTQWTHLSIGFHICFDMPNVEIHLPGCFIRIGWTMKFVDEQRWVVEEHKRWKRPRCYGWGCE